jgi:hypothetical protein
VNDQDILSCATRAAEWLFDRRERLEKHEEEPLTLLWLAVSEIDGIIGCFDVSKSCTASRSTSACYATISLTGSEEAVSRRPCDARRAARPPADACALLSSRGGGTAEAARRDFQDMYFRDVGNDVSSEIALVGGVEVGETWTLESSCSARRPS